MKNVKLSLAGDILTVTINLAKEYGLSVTGKSIIIAATKGTISIPDSDDIKPGLNVYKPV